MGYGSTDKRSELSPSLSDSGNNGGSQPSQEASPDLGDEKEREDSVNSLIVVGPGGSINSDVLQSPPKKTCQEKIKELIGIKELVRKGTIAWFGAASTSLWSDALLSIPNIKVIYTWAYANIPRPLVVSVPAAVGSISIETLLPSFDWLFHDKKFIWPQISSWLFTAASAFIIYYLMELLPTALEMPNLEGITDQSKFINCVRDILKHFQNPANLMPSLEECTYVDKAVEVAVSIEQDLLREKLKQVPFRTVATYVLRLNLHMIAEKIGLTSCVSSFFNRVKSKIWQTKSPNEAEQNLLPPTPAALSV